MLDDESKRSQQVRILYEEKTQDFLGIPQTKATQQATLEEDLRLNTIQKEQSLSRERKLETQLAEAKVSIRELQERQGCRCAICYEGICDTVTRCGHQFCWECFIRWYEEQAQDIAHSYTCPFCRKVLGSIGDTAQSLAIKLHRN